MYYCLLRFICIVLWFRKEFMESLVCFPPISTLTNIDTAACIIHPFVDKEK
jgi:hypothetical protein